MKDYFTIPQVAKICSVNRSTMHRWVTSGKIKSYSTPGGHKRILIQDLKAFLKDNEMPIDINEFNEEKTRILIVDDDSTVQQVLKKILSGIFIEIEVASDGFEAGIKLVKFKPHLIILDLFMPNMDGYEVCKIIKENPSTRKIKILIMTGHGTEKIKNKVMALGADAFLSKPALKKEILENVEKLLK